MRAKRALVNLLFNLVQQVVAILVNFFMPPIIVQNFGSSLNGLISTIRQIMQYVQLTGAGIAQASTYAMYKPIAENDNETLRGIYKATKIMFNKAGHVFSIVVLLVALVYPFFVDQEVDYLIVFLLVIVIGISGSSEFYLCGKYDALLTANQEHFVVATAQTIGNITNLLLLVVLIYFKQNIVVVQLGMSAIYLLRILILTAYVKKKYPYIEEETIPLFNKITQRNDAVIHQVATLIVNGSSTIIVSMICGLKMASVFGVYLLVFQGISILCSLVSGAIYASFGEVIAKGEKDTLLNAYNIFEYVYYIFSSIIYACTFLLIMPFIELYTVNMTDANYYQPMLAILFIVVGVANAIRVPTLTIVTGAGHFKETKWQAIIEMTINLFGQIGFGLLYGINGVLFGCVLSYSYRTLDFIFYAHKNILEKNALHSFNRIIINFIWAFVIVFVLNTFLSPDITSYLEWIKYGLIYVVIIGITIVIGNVLFDFKTFKQVINLFKNLFFNN